MWSRIMENIIEVCGVNKYFGEEHVLKDVSHTFEKGKIHGIVGNNGSGKTVLMKCICGFLKILASLQKKANALTIRTVLEQVGLDPDMKKPVGKYSLGMRQRLGFAQALMEDPSLLILDEPLNGLDKHGVVHIRNVIKGLRAEGKTVILASHNQVDIDELCDTVCEMDAGVLTVVR